MQNHEKNKKIFKKNTKFKKRSFYNNENRFDFRFSKNIDKFKNKLYMFYVFNQIHF